MNGKNLTGVERSIQIFSSDTNELMQEIGIDVSLDQLINIVQSKDDPNLYRFHKLNNNQVVRLWPYLGLDINIDTENFYYVFACFGLYE